jgi:Uma2 family endonuclease
MATAPALYRFTVDEYHRMGAAGVFAEDARVELIDGQIVEMSPVGDAHVEAVNRCNRRFTIGLGDRAVVSPQNPVRLDRHNEPQPDLAVARPEVVGAPRLGEILLAVEVADTSLEYDRGTKVPLYARAGIPETWLLNVRDGVLEVYRAPGPAGYARTATYQPNQRIAPEAFPDLVLRVADLLPPPAPAGRPER